MPNLVFVRDPRLRTLFGLSLAVLLITLSIMYVRIGTIRGPLIAHFDSYRGIDATGGRLDIFLLPVVGLVMLALDMALASALYFRERFVSHLIAFAGLALSLLILIASFAIMSVNL
ncbi:MAG: hypothetical protein A2128_00520 [Candidatus Liptonbacteria bacterium GWC1_60_9]|uniref:DUF1648 domain-containing protein n=3 Tax=Candidatus Liptoniibacteriota TaxID=1817909 RepID=A0A1G2CJQ1_9BACT|nr:MAG: hypothetical protein A2128_00520 [Candidatus Liptonbacteria bacterium GWC1_60_9]OGY99073.1 MAG: hypothetical protein A3E09_02525 [Candidatus Liptonbacteria bacterium RIFCSPHIGHO2_12_FULL_60_13]OGZ01477.1 MAG: hypothetical protein A3G64_01410 [Candidatus Liptonbacteria bacterium RIFCSPLOWO2_12_FULL_60_15]